MHTITQLYEYDISNNIYCFSFNTVCNPCAIQYDFIGKFEHLEEDTKNILKWLKADNLTQSLAPPIRPTNASLLTNHYWNQLPHTLKLSFLKHYILYYLSFDYDFPLRNE
ncbi:hypothetical protein SK128_005293 [Halocaridina rubra]|uniref:Carbohydrate sulfotransferase n=1 Tax=Halocaridina rubra TaxID=373956 RepID=A0AAN9A0Y1_HALRR